MSVASSSHTGNFRQRHITDHRIISLEYFVLSLLFFRMTLLLGPPGAGKTSLLLALAGTLPSSLKVLALRLHGTISCHECTLRVLLI